MRRIEAAGACLTACRGRDAPHGPMLAFSGIIGRFESDDGIDHQSDSNAEGCGRDDFAPFFSVVKKTVVYSVVISIDITFHFPFSD